MNSPVEERVAYVQVNSDPRPEINITEIAIQGQPETDRAFVTDNGTRFRARIIKQAEIDGNAPVREGTRVAPSTIVLSLSLALMDQDNNVAANSADQMMIMDRHEITFTGDAFKLGQVNIAEAIMAAVRQEAAALEAWRDKQVEIADALNAWGGGSAGAMVQADGSGTNLVPIAAPIAGENPAGAGAEAVSADPVNEGSADA